ncbi:MAG: AmmeMemoRadiSam system protein B [Spirochaetes bacterium RBG_13_68_11]|nr:MAG: AmmeMemoRadiSam system protein B [Spirochaetes bacterium RBG_13_68_11]
MDTAPARALVRPPIVDGLFYPGDRSTLRETVERLLDESSVAPGDCFGVVCPHAGYSCAGTVLAAGWNAVRRRQARTVVLLGPVHRDDGPGGPFFLPESRWFATPVGDLPVDAAAVEALAASHPRFRINDVPHLEEHCLEVQLPFIHHLFPGVPIVPILIADRSRAAAATLAECLALTFRDSWDYIVVVATANMTSYLRGTDAEAEYQAIARLVADRDWRGIGDADARHAISTCGPSAIAALLSLAGDGSRVDLLAEGDSRGADAEPDKLVRYAAVGVWRGTSGGLLAD